MPFSKDRLSLLAQVPGWGHLVYQTEDPLAEVLADGYVPYCGSMIRTGDRLTVVSRPPRGVPVQVDCTVVSAASDGVRLVPVLAVVPFQARPGTRRRHAARDAQIVQLRAAGRKVVDIAAEVGVTAAVVGSVLHRARQAADARRAA